MVKMVALSVRWCRYSRPNLKSLSQRFWAIQQKKVLLTTNSTSIRYISELDGKKWGIGAPFRIDPGCCENGIHHEFLPNGKPK